MLVGKATRIDPTLLPESLRELADCQYRRFDHRNAGADLAALGDALARLLPELGAADRDAQAAHERTQAKSRKKLSGTSLTPGCEPVMSSSACAAASGI